MAEQEGAGSSCPECGHSCGGLFKAKGPAALAFLVLALFLLAETVTVVRGWAYIGRDLPNQSTVSVSGKGEVVVKPDIATFGFGVTGESLSVGSAQKTVTDTTNAIFAYLKTAGVADKDVKTTGYTIYPRYEYGDSGVSPAAAYYPPTGKRTLAAYVVSETVEVKVRDIGNAGAIIGGLGELGATDISGLTFTVDDQTAVEDQARSLAIIDAEGRAKKLSDELGVKLVRVLSYSENGPYPIYFAKAAAPLGMGGAATDSAAPSVPSGENTVTSNVTITYEVR